MIKKNAYPKDRARNKFIFFKKLFLFLFGLSWNKTRGNNNQFLLKTSSEEKHTFSKKLLQIKIPWNYEILLKCF